MSAPVLYPGDRIHIAVPVSTPGPYKSIKDVTAEAEEEARKIIEFYKRQGVTVEYWSGGTGVTMPTVVAIFREEPQPVLAPSCSYATEGKCNCKEIKE